MAPDSITLYSNQWHTSSREAKPKPKAYIVLPGIRHSTHSNHQNKTPPPPTSCKELPIQETFEVINCFIQLFWQCISSEILHCFSSSPLLCYMYEMYKNLCLHFRQRLYFTGSYMLGLMVFSSPFWVSICYWFQFGKLYEMT